MKNNRNKDGLYINQLNLNTFCKISLDLFHANVKIKKTL